MWMDAFLAFCSVLLGAQQSAAAKDRVVCGLLGYSHNRKSRRLLSRPGDLSNFASRDETRARLPLERIRTRVSCCSRCRGCAIRRKAQVTRWAMKSTPLLHAY